MLTNIMVLRTIKENANKAVLDALPSILFEGLHNDKDVQKYYLQGPAAEYIPVNIPDETAKKFSKCATALAMLRKKYAMQTIRRGPSKLQALFLR